MLTKKEKMFLTINACIMLLLCIVMLYPMLVVFGRSFMGDLERTAHPLRIIPRSPDLTGYSFILSSSSNIGRGYLITIARTVLGTAFSLSISAMLAYPLSKRYYPLKKPLSAMVVFCMWFSGGLIPNFLVVRSLGLINSFWVYILPNAITGFNVIILRNFFMQIPESLEESAKLDGANDVYIFAGIYVPLSLASFATVGLFYAISHWNSWSDTLLYVNKQELYTLQYILRQLIESASMTDVSSGSSMSDVMPPAETVKMATIVISTVPILCVYPFVQKYFVKGVLVGSVKG